MIAAGRLGHSKGLRPQIYRTLIGLLAGCGLRISEALHLENRDTDLVRGVLTIRETKFRKTRLVPPVPDGSCRSSPTRFSSPAKLTCSVTCTRFYSGRGTEWSVPANKLALQDDLYRRERAEV